MLDTDCDWGEGTDGACPAKAGDEPQGEKGITIRRTRRETRTLFTGSLFPIGFWMGTFSLFVLSHSPTGSAIWGFSARG